MKPPSLKISPNLAGCDPVQQALGDPFWHGVGPDDPQCSLPTSAVLGAILRVIKISHSSVYTLNFLKNKSETAFLPIKKLL